MSVPIFTLRKVEGSAYCFPSGCEWVAPCISKQNMCSVLVNHGFVLDSGFGSMKFTKNSPELVQYQRFPELGATHTVEIHTMETIRVKDMGVDCAIVNVFYSSSKYHSCSLFKSAKLSYSPMEGEYDALVYSPKEPTSIVMGIRQPVVDFEHWLKSSMTHPFQNIMFEPMVMMLRPWYNPYHPFDEGHEAMAKRALAAMEPIHNPTMAWGEKDVKRHMPELYQKAFFRPLAMLFVADARKP